MSHRLSVSEMHMQSPFFVGNLEVLHLRKKIYLKNKTFICNLFDLPISVSSHKINV